MKSSSFLPPLLYEILNMPAKDAGSIVYAPRFLAQFSLPARNLNSGKFIRRNGLYTFSVVSPGDTGLPYGIYPRNILIFLATEVRLTQSGFVDMGVSRAAFKKRLGVGVGAGSTGPSNKFNDQFKRLFSSEIEIASGTDNNLSVESITFSKKASAVWNVSSGAMKGVLELENGFYDDLAKKSFPVDQRVLKFLGHHCLAYDLYLWLTSRVFNLRKPVIVQWLQLEQQFGNQLASRSAFKQKFCKALASVKRIWPKLIAKEHTRGIFLAPCAPHVAVGGGYTCE